MSYCRTDLSQNVCTVPMEVVDFSIKGSDVRSSFHRAGSRAVFLYAAPLVRGTCAKHREVKYISRVLFFLYSVLDIILLPKTRFN